MCHAFGINKTCEYLALINQLMSVSVVLVQYRRVIDRHRVERTNGRTDTSPRPAFGATLRSTAFEFYSDLSCKNTRVPRSCVCLLGISPAETRCRLEVHVDSDGPKEPYNEMMGAQIPRGWDNFWGCLAYWKACIMLRCTQQKINNSVRCHINLWSTKDSVVLTFGTALCVWRTDRPTDRNATRVLWIAMNSSSTLTWWRAIKMPLTLNLYAHFRCSLEEYMGWSKVTVIYGYDTQSMLYGMMLYCAKLTGEVLSRYLNKIESVGLRKT